MSQIIGVVQGDDIGAAFLRQDGVYYDPVGNEFFILTFLGDAPCKTGELIPCCRVEFSDDHQQGAIPNTGQVYLGRL